MFLDSHGTQENIQASTPGSNVRQPARRTTSGPARSKGPRCWCVEQPSPAPPQSRRQDKGVPSQGRPCQTSTAGFLLLSHEPTESNCRCPGSL